MKALLIYKNKSVLWIDVLELRPEYIEQINHRVPIRGLPPYDGTLDPMITTNIYFRAINNPTNDGFIVYLEA